MEFSEIEEIVFKSKDFPQKADKDELFALFALKGLREYFHAGDVNKLAASNHKKRISEWLEATKRPKAEPFEKKFHNRVKEAADMQNKIRLANLHHCNPYVLLLQACKIISILLDDSMMFWQQMKTDCYEIHGRTLLDPRPLEAEREELEADIAKLEKWIAETKDDVYGNNLRRRAIDNMKERLAAITPQEKKKNPFE